MQKIYTNMHMPQLILPTDAYKLEISAQKGASPCG